MSSASASPASSAPGTHGSGPAQTATARRAPALSGTVRVPGDKSVSHRALLFGLLAEGRTHITGLLEGEDVLNTAAACRALGAVVERLGPGEWTVDGVGAHGLSSPELPLDFGNSGTGVRLMMGVVAGQDVTAVFDGDASLRRRPMNRVLDPLAAMGAEVVSMAEGGRLPLTLKGSASLAGRTYETPVPSAQVKSAVLLAGLGAAGETVVVEREATRDHTERLLAHFGADLRVEPFGHAGRRITLQGHPRLKAAPVDVPADPSSAAFPLVAALLVPGSEVILTDLMMNPLRTGLITTLREMGADIAELDVREDGGETVANLRVRHSRLTGIEVPAERAPAMIDEYPILAMAAACAEGDTVMRGLSELRVKESDRLAAVAEGLAACGVDHKVVGDDLIVHGRATVRGGGPVKTCMDHRIAMSFLVLGLVSAEGVTVDDVSFIATSFPTFLPMMRALGAQID